MIIIARCGTGWEQRSTETGQSQNYRTIETTLPPASLTTHPSLQVAQQDSQYTIPNPTELRAMLENTRSVSHLPPSRQKSQAVESPVPNAVRPLTKNRKKNLNQNQNHGSRLCASSCSWVFPFMNIYIYIYSWSVATYTGTEDDSNSRK